MAALAGPVSFASPCVLPPVPGYLGYVTGLTGETLAEKSRSHPGPAGRAQRGARGFLRTRAGAPLILIAAGLDRAGGASRWLRRHQRTIQVVGGVTLVLVGLLMVTGLWQSMNPWLQTELVNGLQVAV